jgi:hypothetical protein
MILVFSETPHRAKSGFLIALNSLSSSNFINYLHSPFHELCRRFIVHANFSIPPIHTCSWCGARHEAINFAIQPSISPFTTFPNDDPAVLFVIGESRQGKFFLFKLNKQITPRAHRRQDIRTMLLFEGKENIRIVLSLSVTLTLILFPKKCFLRHLMLAQFPVPV